MNSLVAFVTRFGDFGDFGEEAMGRLRAKHRAHSKYQTLPRKTTVDMCV